MSPDPDAHLKPKVNSRVTREHLMLDFTGLLQKRPVKSSIKRQLTIYPAQICSARDESYTLHLLSAEGRLGAWSCSARLSLRAKPQCERTSGMSKGKPGTSRGSGRLFARGRKSTSLLHSGCIGLSWVLVMGLRSPALTKEKMKMAPRARTCCRGLHLHDV